VSDQSSKKNLQKFNGLLAVNKPYGMVSKDISRWLTKRLGKVKLGHVGTLDPRAEGVLPILFGTATRLQDYLLESPKVYECDCQLGEQTETLDTEGEVVKTMAWDHVTESDIQAAAKCFVGDVEQVPPIYSAIKYKGKSLYEYARKGLEDQVNLEDLKRQIFVHSFEVLGIDLEKGIIRIRVTSSKGTYVRVLVKDFAEKLNTCGNMVKLVRVESSGIKIEDTYQLEEIEKKIDDFATMLVSIEDIGLSLPGWKTQEDSWTEKLLSGQPLRMETSVFDCLFATPNKKIVPESLGTSMILLNESGKAFGIGSVKLDRQGGVNVSMKRGLL